MREVPGSWFDTLSIRSPKWSLGVSKPLKSWAKWGTFSSLQFILITTFTGELKNYVLNWLLHLLYTNCKEFKPNRFKDNSNSALPTCVKTPDMTPLLFIYLFGWWFRGYSKYGGGDWAKPRGCQCPPTGRRKAYLIRLVRKIHIGHLCKLWNKNTNKWNVVEIYMYLNNMWQYNPKIITRI